MESKTNLNNSNTFLVLGIELENIPLPTAIHNKKGEVIQSNKLFKDQFLITNERFLDNIIPGFKNNYTKKYLTFRDINGNTKGFKIDSKQIEKNIILSSFVDVSDIIQENTTLTNSNHVKDKFIRVISHDLKNPLTSIHGFADLLLNRYNEYDTNTQLHFLKIILECSAQGHELINNLLYWTKNETKEITTEIEQVDIQNLIDDCVNFVLPSSKAKNINISFSIDDIRFIHCDKHLTSAIVRNLLSNAIKFTNHNGKIKIEVIRKEDQIKISVKDNGIGISSKKQLALYTNTIQQSELGTDQEIGSGIGLMIVKDFIKLQKGTFGIESKVKKGTNFWFTLPEKDN